MLNFEYLVDPTVDAPVLQAEQESPYDSHITIYTQGGQAGIHTGFKDGKSGQLSALLFCLLNCRAYNDAVAEISTREYGEQVIGDANAIAERIAEQSEEFAEAEENPAIVQPIEFHQQEE